MTCTLELEYTTTGPLSHRSIVEALEVAVAGATTLDEADPAINTITGLATYRGGRHIAVHPCFNGKFASGSKRLAIITEEAA